MDNITTALKKALDEGRGFDEAMKEIMREQMEKATNDIVRMEMSEFLGYEKGEQGASMEAGDSRNGSYERKIVTKCGTITVSMPRNRNGKFESAVAPRYSRRTDGVADLVKAKKLLSDMFAIFADATYVPLRRDSVDKEAVMVIVGIDRQGCPSVLCMAISPTEYRSAWEGGEEAHPMGEQGRREALPRQPRQPLQFAEMEKAREMLEVS